MRLAPICLLAAAWAPLVLGCGQAAPGKSVVKGRIVQDGEPLVVEGMEIGVGRIEVLLVGADGFARERALANADGYFTFIGDGEGIKPGTYKIAVKQLEQRRPGGPPPGPPTGPPGPQSGAGDVDKLAGDFDEKNTPIEREIGEGDVDLGTIDLAKEKK